MKRILALSVCLLLFLSSCTTAAQSQVNTSSVSSQSIISSSGSKAQSTSQETSSVSAGKNQNLTEIAKTLYSQYLDEHVKNYDLLEYRIDSVTIEKSENEKLEFSVVYDVHCNPISISAFGRAGNGIIQDDGWVIKKYAYVKAVKVNGNYTIESQGTGI